MKDTITDKTQVSWKNSLKFSLVLWFLLLSLVPLSVISYLNYLDTAQNIEHNVIGELQKSSNAEMTFIENWFDDRKTDILNWSQIKSNVSFLAALKSQFKESTKTPDNFVKSYDYIELVSQMQEDLLRLVRDYDYIYDLFLIDESGNILFTVAKEQDLGANLLSDLYSKTKFSHAYQQTLQDGKIHYSDLEFYEPSNGEIVSFLTTSLVDEEGKIIGVIAVQLKLNHIYDLFKDESGKLQNKRHYITGEEGLLRTNLSSDAKALLYQIDTSVFEHYKHDHLLHKDEIVHDEEITFKYKDSFGDEVLGLHQRIDILGVKWVLFNEVTLSSIYSEIDTMENRTFMLFLITMLIVVIAAFFIASRLTKPITALSIASKKFTQGDRDVIVDISTKNEIGELAISFRSMIDSLSRAMVADEKDRWVQTGIELLNAEVLRNNTIAELSTKSLHTLCNYINAGIGSLYSFNKETETLERVAGYAFVQKKELSNFFKLGEGTVGQVALQRTPIQLKNIKQVQLVIDTGTSSEIALDTYTFPLLYQDELQGVIEIGSSVLFDEKTFELFTVSNSIIAIALATAKQNESVKELLIQSKIANSQMQEQQQQLEEANTEMEETQQQLEEANAQMEESQQQLEETNAQMEEQQQQLTATTMMLKEKNDKLEKSKEELDKKAKDLEAASKYKSEFLANMSHELRTPLNSIILLSDMLHDNKGDRLDKEEVKKASIIHASGNELLRLINDVLDLSKIEAGRMELIVDKFDSTILCENFQDQFEHAVEQKNLKFVIEDNYKGTIINDQDRLSQVIRNLMSNSLKFTKEGGITLQIDETKDKKVKLSVIDTGIGIAAQKTKSIFEAFQQADGSTSRKYGGTGLGLSISKELVRMMGGEIILESEPGKGSTFSIIIPNLHDDLHADLEAEPVKIQSQNLKPIVETVKNRSAVSDDRDILTSVDSTFLIIEDDEELAAILRNKINEKNENALIALNGKDGIRLATQYNIKGVMLDLGLPDMDGIDVLKEFKTNLALRKIPVYIVSGQDRERITKEQGALGFAQKPISSDAIVSVIDKINTFNNKIVKDLLIVEDNKNQREALIEFIGNGTIKSHGVDSASAAIKELEKGIYDGVIVDLGLQEGSGYDVCEYIHHNNLKVPIIIYTGSDLTQKEEKNLRRYTDSIIIKTANSQIRLLDEVDIFMHRVKVKTGKSNENITDIDLSGKKILVVDDDIRNIYVLSEALSSKGANVITASDGQEAIEVLNQNLDTSMVLMDIMMPIMNGYESTKIIKNDDKTKHIPVIAVTAKAMQEDKESAIKAGCDDFITKPLKMDTLIGIVKGWLDKS